MRRTERPLLATVRDAMFALALAWLCAADAAATEVAVDALRHPLEDRGLVEPEQVLRELKPLIERAKAAGETRESALLMLARANACRVLADLHCQRDAGQAAAEAARQAQDARLEARGLILEARAYMALQDYSQGERQLAEAEVRLASVPDSGLSADIDLGYSSLSHSLGKHALALEYADRGLARLRPEQEPALKIRLLRNRARALTHLGQRIAAREALRRALDTGLPVDDPKLRAELYLEQARLALRSGDAETQRRSAEQVIALAKQLGSSQLAGQGYEALGLFAHETGNLPRAQQHLETAATTFRTQGLTREELRVLRSLIAVMRDAQRPSPEREPVTQRYLEIEGEVMQADRAQAADDFDARLKYAQSENEVLRLEGEAALAQERARTLEAANRINRIVNGAAAVGLLMLLGFYLLQRRSNRQLRQAMRAARESESRATALLQLSTGYVFLHDLDGRVLMMNSAAAEALGTSPQAVVGSEGHRFVAEDEFAAFEQYLRTLRETGAAEGTIKMRRTDGGERYWRYGNRVATVDNESRYVIGHAVDVTEDIAQTEALRQRSEHDALTGAWNRRYLEDFERSQAGRWAVVNVDLDHFKQINDTYGHERGDEVLVEVTRFLQQRVREQDAVVRAGGDEFLLLLADATESALDGLIERLQHDIAKAPCGLSLGWALREGQESLADTLVRADASMYQRRRVARAEQS